MNKKLPEFIVAYSNASQEVKDLLDSSIIGDYIGGLEKIPPGYKISDLIAECANYILDISTVEEVEVMLLPLGYSTSEARLLIGKIKNLSTPLTLLTSAPSTGSLGEVHGHGVQEQTYRSTQSDIMEGSK